MNSKLHSWLALSVGTLAPVVTLLSPQLQAWVHDRPITAAGVALGLALWNNAVKSVGTSK